MIDLMPMTYEPLELHVSPLVLRTDPRYPGAWQQLSPYLESALERDEAGDWNIQDVYRLACAHQVQLWALTQGSAVFGALVTSESVYPQRKVLDILLLGTDPHTEEKWFECLDQLKSIAKLGGAHCLQGTGRPGWAKKLNATRRKIVWEIDL